MSTGQERDAGMDKVDQSTLEEERHEATLPADAGSMPTAEEERAAEGNEVSPEVAASYEESLERGKDVKGEGRIA